MVLVNRRREASDTDDLPDLLLGQLFEAIPGVEMHFSDIIYMFKGGWSDAMTQGFNKHAYKVVADVLLRHAST